MSGTAVSDDPFYMLYFFTDTLINKVTAFFKMFQIYSAYNYGGENRKKALIMAPITQCNFILVVL